MRVRAGSLAVTPLSLFFAATTLRCSAAEADWYTPERAWSGDGSRDTRRFEKEDAR